MTATAYRLYARYGAGSIAVQIALEEAGAPYEITWIARTPEAVEAYRRVNPAGRIPALALPGGAVMSESAAILIYLAAQYPQARLAPSEDTPGYAHFLQWMVSLSANLYETALRYFYSERYTSGGAAAAQDVKACALADYRRQLAAADAQLRPYLLGETYSLADPYLYMLAGWYPQDATALLKELPALARHARLLRERAAVRRAEAEHAEPASGSVAT
jgi:glutathione S-transferase